MHPIIHSFSDFGFCPFRELTSILTMKNGAKEKKRASHLSIDTSKTRNCLRGSLRRVNNQAWSKSRDTNLKDKNQTTNGT